MAHDNNCDVGTMAKRRMGACRYICMYFNPSTDGQLHAPVTLLLRKTMKQSTRSF